MSVRTEVALVGVALVTALVAVLLVPAPHGELDLRLLRLAATADPQVVEQLIDAGADLDARDSMGMTPLHWAAYRGRQSTVQLLLDRGADPLAVNHDGLTPAEVAASRNRERHRQLIESHRP